MQQHKESVGKRKARIIRDLIDYGYTKHVDGRQLYELPLPELENLYIDLQCESIPMKQEKK